MSRHDTDRQETGRGDMAYRYGGRSEGCGYRPGTPPRNEPACRVDAPRHETPSLQQKSQRDDRRASYDMHRSGQQHETHAQQNMHAQGTHRQQSIQGQQSIPGQQSLQGQEGTYEQQDTYASRHDTYAQDSDCQGTYMRDTQGQDTQPLSDEAEDANEHVLYVSNVPYNANRSDLHSLIESVAPVLRVRFPRSSDGRAGRAWLTFASYEAAKKVLLSEPKIVLFGRTLRFNWARATGATRAPQTRKYVT